MKMKWIQYLVMALSIGVMVGCTSGKEENEFNKPAHYWYQKVAQSIAKGQVDRADDYYVSLRSEHMRSPLLPEAMLMLAYAHMDKEEYLLANYYFDEYDKRYADGADREYMGFMKLKSAFLGVKDVYKDQKLILDTIYNAQRYKEYFPTSEYLPLVDTMLVKLHMAQYLLNENIAALYDRTGKPKAAKIYREKNKGSLVEMTDITPPKKGILGKIFD